MLINIIDIEQIRYFWGKLMIKLTIINLLDIFTIANLTIDEI